jgi:hypothetical protein
MASLDRSLTHSDIHLSIWFFDNFMLWSKEKRIQTEVGTFTYGYIYTCIYKDIYTWIHIHIYMNIHMYTYIHIYINIYIQIYIYIYIYTCTHTYSCTYVYGFKQRWGLIKEVACVLVSPFSEVTFLRSFIADIFCSMPRLDWLL